VINSKSTWSYWGRHIACVAISMAVAGGAVAQSSEDSAEDTYSALLQEIADKKVIIDQQQVFIKTQESRIASLDAQIAQVPQTNETVQPMIDKMVAAIENEINSDIPFNIGERFQRLDALKEEVAKADVNIADKMRRALNIYDIEVAYGQAVEAYDGDHPSSTTPGARRAACLQDKDSEACGLSESLIKKIRDGQEIEDLADTIFDGVFLRHGRLSLAYISADGSEALQYDVAAKEWMPVSASKVIDIRRGIRIARGQSAPGVMMAPVLVSAE